MTAGGKALVVVPLAHDRAAWSELLEGSGLEFEFISDRHQLAQALRIGGVSGVVIDADACAAGGLGELALLRGRAERSLPRVVVASQPTRTHLVSCLAAGATGYMPKPILPAALIEQLATVR